MNKQPSAAFGIGTGRCGTRFLYELIHHSKEVIAFHEQHPLSDAFLRYGTWYKLPIDLSSCWQQKENIVKQALDKGLHYFESSAYLSLNIPELYQRFDAKFIFLVRHPRAVVDSYYIKGWYKTPVIREQSDLAPGIQPDLELPHHHFSRIVAYGPEGKAWKECSRIGQLAWFWQEINKQILMALDQLPMSQYKVIRLEDFTFEKYLDICAFLEIAPTMRESRFVKTAATKFNRSKKNSLSKDWTAQEKKEFRYYVAVVAEQLGYEI
ncbi:MAG: hypothetical protein ACI8P3_004569 [Saprospiraceae bacterium]|jgi:hypothetical protein